MARWNHPPVVNTPDLASGASARACDGARRPAVNVALLPAPSGLPDTLTYEVPDSLGAEPRAGACVLVPLGEREMLGYVTGPASASPHPLKPVVAIIEAQPAFDESMLALLDWTAAEYCSSLSDALPMAVPLRQSLRIETHVRAAPGWDGSLAGRSGPISARTAKAIYQALAEAGGTLSRDHLLAKIPQAGVAAVLRRCRSEGSIIEERVLLAPQVRPLVAKAVALADGRERTQPRRLGPRQREVMQFLLALPDDSALALQRDICRELGIASDVVRRLEAGGMVASSRIAVRRRPRIAERPAPVHVLTPAQEAATNVVQQAVGEGSGRALLLFGVTGSGKTEIYLRAIESARERGRTAILLVPEISLTAQVASAVRARLGERIALLHSAMSDGERYDEWERIRRGEADIVLGPRSALFAPVADPGIIIVDEEHDSSYKQSERAPRYHAREVAMRRAALSDGCVVLGSATPALESYHRATHGSSTLIELKERVLGRPFPAVRIVDLRRESRAASSVVFGEHLSQALRERIGRGEQAILFVNRRGFSAFLLCRDCGLVPRCDRCDVSLTLHRRRANILMCHYCGLERAAPAACPRCGGARLRPFGVGTQRVEAAARELLPGARVARLDRDSTRGRGSHARIIEGFGAGKVDVLVGTQMVTKGFDFPSVTLVGVVTADVALNCPDFRAGERTFQLLTQVSGRAGRGALQGEVIVQTFNPEHPSIVAAAQHDYERFASMELPARRALGYPPYGRLVRVLASDVRQGAAEGKIRAAAAVLAEVAGREEVEVLGPAAAPLTRLDDRYRWHLVLRSCRSGAIHSLLRETRAAMKQRAGSLAVDVDPVDLL